MNRPPPPARNGTIGGGRGVSPPTVLVSPPLPRGWCTQSGAVVNFVNGAAKSLPQFALASQSVYEPMYVTCIRSPIRANPFSGNAEPAGTAVRLNCDAKSVLAIWMGN